MSQAGILSISSSVVAQTLTGNDGVVVSAIGNNINVVGTGVVSSGISTSGNIYVTGDIPSATLTINETQAQYLTNYTAKAFADSPYVVSLTDYFISLNTSGGAITVQLPNAPSNYRLFVVKDRTGNAGANNVTITTVGGAIMIDSGTSILINSNYESVTLIFNGTSYEVL